MENILFVLIDATSPSFYKRYQFDLQQIHQKLKEKLQAYDILVLGHEESLLAENRFKDSQSLYRYIAQSSKGRDIVIVDAFAGMLSLADTDKVVNYLKQNSYDICLTENIPEGIVPMVIASSFIDELVGYLEENQPIISSIKELINWEYKGIDVGVYLSSSLLVMERIDFLPINKMSVEYILEYASHKNLTLEKITELTQQNSFFLRNYPQYIAIEISSLGDQYMSASYNYPDMEIELFRKIITEIDELSPESLISIGIWGDPLTHQYFTEIMSILQTIPNPVLIESRSVLLNQEYVNLILSRPNTEWINDISFTTEEAFKSYKITPYSLQDVKQFIQSYKTVEHVWVRLTRTKNTESHLKSFIKEWNEFSPRILITKADSFGKDDVKVVDLAPLKRHACYALRREMTILNNGDMLLCRQSSNVLGNVKSESLKSLWNKNNSAYQHQLSGQFNTCKECALCDDWWIWN